MNEADPYFLGYRQAEQDRLGRQAQELAADSNWLFDHVDVQAGWRGLSFSTLRPEWTGDYQGASIKTARSSVTVSVR